MAARRRLFVLVVRLRFQDNANTKRKHKTGFSSLKTRSWKNVPGEECPRRLYFGCAKLHMVCGNSKRSMNCKELRSIEIAHSPTTLRRLMGGHLYNINSDVSSEGQRYLFATFDSRLELSVEFDDELPVVVVSQTRQVEKRGDKTPAST